VDRRRLLVAAAALAVLAWGCDAVLSLGSFTFGDAGSDAGGDCAAGANKATLENACTSATCVPFDDGRLSTCTVDAGNVSCPTAAPSDAGIPPPLTIPDGGWDAGAIPSCDNLPSNYPKPYIFGSGSSALSLYVGKIAQAFENQGKGTILYQIAGSCYGSYTTVLGYPLESVPASTGNGTATYFDPQQSDTNGVPIQYTCAITDPSQQADFGVSDVFPATCLPQLQVTGGLPSNLHDFFGPVQTMVFAVPTGSSQTSISVDAAYMVWGFGNASGVVPWTDETHMLQRSGSSGTQSMMSATMGLDPFAWKGIPHKANQDVLTDILAAGGAAEATIGVLGADFVEDNRAQIKVLSIQDRGQKCGYYPDSTAAAHDKQNVRDGHYPVWGPSHFIAPVDSNAQPTNPTVKQFVDALSGTSAVTGLDLLQTYVQRHVVPLCAMHVTRSSDGQDYTPYTPPVSCGCYYDFLASGAAPADCTPCTNSSDCTKAPAGRTSCNLFGSPPVGYCELPGQ
jgi:ABC-type phosphate transport system substrate-binding protein